MKRFSSFFGKKPSSNLSDFQRVIAQSMEELRLKTQAHDATWHLSEAAWFVDQDKGTIVFTTSQGVTATCPVQIIGTYNTQNGTWWWGWDHPSVKPALQENAWQVYEYGKTHNIVQLTTGELICSESEAWEFTALACKLCDAQGAYRGSTGSTLIFMTFKDVSLSATPT
jgi:hypothetical protein